VLINQVSPLTYAENILQKDDVLTSIDEVEIANDGTVPFRNRFVDKNNFR